METDEPLRLHVEFERSLRERVAAVMGGQAGAAPQGLSARIRQAMAGAGGQAGSSTAAAIPARIEKSRRSVPGRWRSWVQEPSRANALAVAASLLLVGGAVLFGILGRPIDDWARPPESGDLVAASALWAAQEHAKCADPGRRSRKLVVREPRLVAADLGRYLSTGFPALPDLSGLGYSFVGAGHCEVPGSDASGHMLWERRSEGLVQQVSVFVVRDDGQFPGLLPLQWVAADGGPQCQRQVLQATDGRIVYFLVCCDERDLGPVSRLILPLQRFR
jgi:hypothetical protein